LSFEIRRAVKRNQDIIHARKAVELNSSSMKKIKNNHGAQKKKGDTIAEI